MSFCCALWVLYFFAVCFLTHFLVASGVASDEAFIGPSVLVAGFAAATLGGVIFWVGNPMRGPGVLIFCGLIGFVAVIVSGRLTASHTLPLSDGGTRPAFVSAFSYLRSVGYAVAAREEAQLVMAFRREVVLSADKVADALRQSGAQVRIEYRDQRLAVDLIDRSTIAGAGVTARVFGERFERLASVPSDHIHIFGARLESLGYRLEIGEADRSPFIVAMR